MKVIRITDDRYLLDAGPHVTRAMAAEIGDRWVEWWRTEFTVPTALVLGGTEVPLEYEDRREPDVGRLTAVEEKLDRIWDAIS